jgi:NAD(P)-dependent dehydrogenase (short-subunit alcohol dehydrogenase family)
MGRVSSPPVVVITGASRGIGAGLVAGYRRLGYGVVANARNVMAS